MFTRSCGTWMHYAMRDVKDMGQQVGYRSLKWNWPKEAMNRPFCFFLVPVYDRGTGWYVSVSQPPAEVCLTDLAWDYPGV